MEGEFPWHRVWVLDVSSKVVFFVWTAAFDQVLTIDNFVRHRHILVPGVIYVMVMRSL